MKNYYALLSFAFALFFSINLTAQDVIWEEDFDGDADGWESVSITPNDTSDWYWEPTGFVGDGAITAQFLDPNLSIDSETAANGAIVYNADFFTTLGDPDNIPSGPPSTYPKYIGELISPSIDLSAVSNAVSLQWTQLYTILNVSPGATFRSSLQWSTDGGLTWSDPVDANEDKDINTVYNGDIQTIPIPDIEGEANVRFKFTFASDFYHWVLDDIKVIEREANNMRTNENFFAIAPNLLTPASQVEEFGFLCDIENIGGQDQTGVVLSITINEDGGGTQVYFDEEEYGTIGVDSIAENVSFGAYTPDGTVTSYSAVYEVSADSADFDPSDNSISWGFAVTDSTFAKEDAPTRSIYPAEDNWNPGDPRSWAYGNFYHIVNGAGYYPNTVSFSIDVSDSDDPDPVGQNVRIRLDKWEDNNADTNADVDERENVALYNYTITGDEEFDEIITAPLTDLFTGYTPELEDDTDYILIIEFIAEDETRVDFGASDDYDYSAMILNSEQIGEPRYAGMLGISADLESEPLSSVGFGGNFVPVVRLNVGDEPLISENNDNTVGVLNNDNLVKLFPNPATDQVQLDIDLVETASTVTLDLLDLQGRTLQTNDLGSLKSLSTNINVSNLPTGTYFVRISTDLGTRVERLVIK
ncbi:MAG: T9SS type A sorting domain-containing protein [Bacteroidetes bacterium]|nr:T9SS type A sorting domain-containing protein [Bacteroidota bacterium]